MSTPIASEPDITLSGGVYSPDEDLPVSHPPNRPLLASPNTSLEAEPISRCSAQFDPLSYPVLSELCSIWFKKYHPWFPILHQPSLTTSLQHLESLESSNQYLVVKAICAVTLVHHESPLVSMDELKQWSDNLRDAIWCQALKQVSLQCLQSLLILSNLDYGEGRFEQFWNLIALCKRSVSLPCLSRLVLTESAFRLNLAAEHWLKNKWNSSAYLHLCLHAFIRSLLQLLIEKNGSEHIGCLKC